MSNTTTKIFIVSVISTVVDFVVFNVMLLLFDSTLSTYYFVFVKGTSFLFAVTNSYVWNVLWVFKRKKFSFKTFFQFVNVNIFSLAVNLAVATFMYSILSGYVEGDFIAGNTSALLGSLSGLYINIRGYKKIFKQ